MRIIHVETTRLRNSTVVQPVGACGTHGFYPCAWAAVFVPHGASHAKIRAAWARANPNTVIGSIDAPAIAGIPA